MLVTGAKPYKRALKTSDVCTVLKFLTRDECIKINRAKPTKKPADDDPFAGLGLDPVAEDDSIEEVASARKRRKCLAVSKDLRQRPLTITVPIRPRSSEVRQIKVLASAERDAPWMELTIDNVTWLRDYIIAELVPGDDEPSTPPPTSQSGASSPGSPGAPSPATTTPKGINWCHHYGQYRIYYWKLVGGRRKRLAKSITVTREPLGTYAARADKALVKAKKLLAELQSEQEVLGIGKALGKTTKSKPPK
jgi:hypothetical protein